MRHDEHWYCEDHRPPGRRGVVYQNFWMRKRGISPVPAWLVGWFVIPLKNFERGGKGGAMPNGSPLAMKGKARCRHSVLTARLTTISPTSIWMTILSIPAACAVSQPRLVSV